MYDKLRLEAHIFFGLFNLHERTFEYMPAAMRDYIKQAFKGRERWDSGERRLNLYQVPIDSLDIEKVLGDKICKLSCDFPPYRFRIYVDVFRLYEEGPEVYKQFVFYALAGEVIVEQLRFQRNDPNWQAMLLRGGRQRLDGYIARQKQALRQNIQKEQDSLWAQTKATEKILTSLAEQIAELDTLSEPRLED